MTFVTFLSKRLPFPLSISTSSKNVALVYADIYGPYSTPSIDGHYYFLTLVDDFSHFTWIILMKCKSETRRHLFTFISFIEIQFFTYVKCLRTDNGNEFMLHDFFPNPRAFYTNVLVSNALNKTSWIERKHHHILNVDRTLSFQGNLPKYFWHFSI